MCGVERKIKYYALESTDVLNKLAGPEAAWYVSLSTMMPILMMLTGDEIAGIECYVCSRPVRRGSSKATDGQIRGNYSSMVRSLFHSAWKAMLKETTSARCVFPVEQRPTASGDQGLESADVQGQFPALSCVYSALMVPPDRSLCAAYGQADGGRILVVCGESATLTGRGDGYLADSRFVACYAMYAI